MDATATGAAARGDDQNGVGRDGHQEKKDATAAAAAAAKKVSLLGMFRYADRLDVLLMVVGTVGAVANGVAEPLMTVLFGNVIDSFGDSTTQNIIRKVSKVVLNFIYLGIGAAVVSFLQVSCWTMAGERQSARIRSLYLNAVLRQDIAFFDTELTTGQAASRMSSDTLVIQDALGEKVLDLFSHNISRTEARTDLWVREIVPTIAPPPQPPPPPQLPVEPSSPVRATPMELSSNPLLFF